MKRRTVKNLDEKRFQASKIVDKQLDALVKIANSWKSLTQNLDAWTQTASTRKEKIELLALRKKFTQHKVHLARLADSVSATLNDL